MTSETGTSPRSVRWHAHRVLDVDDADDVVRAVADDREAREPGRPCLLDDADHGIDRAQGDHPRARRHDLVGAPVAERDRALQQRRRRPAPACPAAPSGPRATSAPPASAPTPAPPGARSRSGAAPRSRRSLKSAIAGRFTVVNPRMKPWTALAVCSGSADGEVLRDQLAEDHRDGRREDQRDRHRDAVHRAGRDAEASSGPSMSRAIAGSAMKPMSRFVIVMPSCAPESCVERLRSALSTPRAAPSPASAARSTVERSTVTKENSAATNAPQATHERERHEQQEDFGHRPDLSPRRGGDVLRRRTTGRLVEVAVGHRVAPTDSTRAGVGRRSGAARPIGRGAFGPTGQTLPNSLKSPPSGRIGEDDRLSRSPPAPRHRRHGRRRPGPRHGLAARSGTPGPDRIVLDGARRHGARRRAAATRSSAAPATTSSTASRAPTACSATAATTSSTAARATSCSTAAPGNDTAPRRLRPRRRPRRRGRRQHRRRRGARRRSTAASATTRSTPAAAPTRSTGGEGDDDDPLRLRPRRHRRRPGQRHRPRQQRHGGALGRLRRRRRHDPHQPVRQAGRHLQRAGRAPRPDPQLRARSSRPRRSTTRPAPAPG